MRDRLDEFVHHANVARFAEQLAATDESLRREMLLTLLAEEEALAVARGWPPTPT